MNGNASFGTLDYPENFALSLSEGIFVAIHSLTLIFGLLGSLISLTLLSLCTLLFIHCLTSILGEVSCFLLAFVVFYLFLQNDPLLFFKSVPKSKVFLLLVNLQRKLKLASLLNLLKLLNLLNMLKLLNLLNLSNLLNLLNSSNLLNEETDKRYFLFLQIFIEIQAYWSH